MTNEAGRPGVENVLIRRCGNWLDARTGDDTMMMGLESGTYLGINAVGTRIWELVAQPIELEAICDALVAEFDVAPDICRREVMRFVADMEARGALSVAAA